MGQQLITAFHQQNKLTPTLLHKLLDDSMSRLDFSHATHVRDDICAVIGQCCPTLSSLSLAHCVHLTPHGLGPLLQTLGHHLRHVDVSGCVAMNEECLMALPRWCPLLESLVVTSCPRVTSAGFQQVLQGCSKLTQLVVSQCPGWHDSMMSCVPWERMKVWESVGCDSISAKAWALCISRAR